MFSVSQISRLQLVLEDFEINLAVARQPVVIHLAGQFLEGFARESQPAGAGRRRNVIEQIVKTMVAQTRGLHRLAAEMLVKIAFEKGV